MIEPTIGYIHITQFMETTSHEVQEALDKFGPNVRVCSSTCARIPAAC